MPDTDVFLDPRQIIIHRDKRQRQENITEVEDLKQSIKSIGIINPIVVRSTSEGYVLVAGERRLTASLQLGLPQVPVRFLDKLTHEDAEVIELEENIKRKELAWKDQVRAIGRIHALYCKKDNKWTIQQTAENISLNHAYLRRILRVFDALDTGRVAKAENIDQAYNMLQRFTERKAESIVNDLVVQGAKLFGNIEQNTAAQTFTTVNAVKTTSTRSDEMAFIDEADNIPDDIWNDLKQTKTTDVTISSIYEDTTAKIPDPIQQANFHEWVKTYNGPKFTLIHCDFPYGNYKGNDSKGSMSGVETEDFYDNTEDVYWNLLHSLTTNLDNIMSYSAHMVFWFNMNFYTETVLQLRKTGLVVHDHPLIWHKTIGGGGLGVAPGTEATHPRRTYDTALLAVRGNRPLVRTLCNSYAAPTAGNKIHPSQKPEPMLRYFLQMFVDETTTMLDPTCGSGAALRAAEDLGAKSILGLELDNNYVETANTLTLKARVLRQAGSSRKDG